MNILFLILGILIGSILTGILMSKRCKHEWEETGYREYRSCIDYYQKCKKCNSRRTIQG